MVRRALWIVATAVACVAIAVTSFFLFRSPKPAPPEYHPPEEIVTPGANPLPPVPPSPPIARANTILPLPKIDDPAAAAALAPTLISIDFERADRVSAMQAFSEASGLSINLPPNAPLNADPQLLSLHLQNQPLMEAFLQLEAQGLSIAMPQASAARMPQANAAPGAPLIAQFSWDRRAGPGLWSITGPFTFILTNISHTVSLDRQGQPGPGFIGRGLLTALQAGGDTLTMQLTARVEPKIHILRYPMQLELTEAVDERGHSLLASPGNAPGRGIASGSDSSTNSPLRVTLAYPPQDAGRIIKTLRATASYTLQLDSILVKIDDPMANLPTEKTVFGITISIGKGTWNELSHVLDMTVIYKRGTFTGDWAVTAQGLAGIRPRVVRRDGQSTNVSCNADIAGDTVTAQYGVMLPTLSPRPVSVGVPTELPPLESITFDFPTGTTQLTVPVEFHDLPLP